MASSGPSPWQSSSSSLPTNFPVVAVKRPMEHTPTATKKFKESGVVDHDARLADLLGDPEELDSNFAPTPLSADN
eukprot:2528080-Karenia_brevis.AAC.1